MNHKGKQKRKIFEIISIRCTMFAITLLVLLWNFSNKSRVEYEEMILWQQCIDYESTGYIPINSCECTRHLFKEFSHNYDWSDSCQIIESKNCFKLNLFYVCVFDIRLYKVNNDQIFN